MKTQVTRIASYVLMFSDDKVLLCRLLSHIPHAGKWTLPGGGIDFGEDPADGAVREVWEETGLHVSGLELVGIDSCFIEGPHTEHHGVRILYQARQWQGEITHEVDGSTDLAEWIPLKDVTEETCVDLVLAGLRFARTACS